MRKAITAVLLTIILTTGFMIYVDRNYLFTPFSELDRDITVRPWYKFRKPLELEISLIEQGWKSKRIQDEVEIIRILEDLEQLEYSGTEIIQKGRHFVITLRQPDTKDHAGLLLQFDGYEDGDIRINNGKAKRLSNDFRNKIKGILDDIERVT
ncbi:hypothetical protein [Paenibacillus sp.]|uniref:hypothetical protein n=1 Tax=Paenibacillus sp. TaxID=58172 RepID=UPI002D276A63|nr:hypothetical protein [Paenibacillus sp.]HZG86721.1 hypothetical protein [Paenibacillus sp.]